MKVKFDFYPGSFEMPQVTVRIGILFIQPLRWKRPNRVVLPLVRYFDCGPFTLHRRRPIPNVDTIRLGWPSLDA